MFKFPYTDFHSLNTDWIIKKINEFAKSFPTKISQLINDSGYLTEQTVPVKSVNNKIGHVQLNYQDVNALPGNLPVALGTHDSGSALRFNLVESNIASGNYSFAAGRENESSAGGSVTFGRLNKATGSFSSAIGYGNTASAQCAHAEGDTCTASEYCAHAEGYQTEASGPASHAEGTLCKATSNSTHAEGERSDATAIGAHAEGYKNLASGVGAHVEGRNSVASGYCAHVEGEYCVGDHWGHHVFGQYNAIDPKSTATDRQRGEYVEMVGNGTSTTARSNARTLDWNGNEILAGKLTMGADPSDPMDAASKKYVDRSVIGYGETDATSTSTNFTATIPGITELNNSTIILIKNTAATSASGCTLNVNNLGAKPIYNNMGNASITTLFKVNYTFLMLYDSSLDTDGAWIMYLGYYQNDNTIGYQIRSQTTQTMLGVMGRYRLIFQSADNKHYVAANQSTSTSASAAKAVTTTPINPFGNIQYYSNSGSITNGNKPSASYVWKQYICDSIGYSFSPGGTVTPLIVGEPVYLKCTPQANGSAIIDPTTPIVTDLPTTEDGKIYIMLGIGNTTTKLELQINHPVYQFKNGKICLYTGN